MKLSIGDVIDRWTIAYLKNQRGKLDTIAEIDAYITHCSTYNQKDVSEAFKQLLQYNGDIWLLESDIRQGKEGELGLEEVGRRALLIRDLNKKRIEIKNSINLRYSEGFIEKKVNHASE